jgi:hypothetical protein
VRIWDCTEVVQKTVIKPQLAKPVRTAVTTCSYSSDGSLIAAGLMDGSIQLWSATGKFGSSAAVGQVGGWRRCAQAAMVVCSSWCMWPCNRRRSVHGPADRCIRWVPPGQMTRWILSSGRQL